MRKLLRAPILGFASFLVVAYFYPGLSYESIAILVLSSTLFGFLSLTVRPILRIFSLPLNLFTFGLFSFFSGAILIYLVSIFIPGFSIVGFDFSGVEISGFSIPSLHLIPIFSALVASILISWLNVFLKWLFH